MFDHTKPKVKIMGILNVTPDSFSDGGKYFNTNQAIQKGFSLLHEGAHILDIGGESTRPGATPVSAQEELDRILPVIEAISPYIDSPNQLISVDTYKAVVADRALEAGAHIVNDVYGLRDPDMVSVLKKHLAHVIVMHTRGTPQTMKSLTEYDDVVADVGKYFRDKKNQLKSLHSHVAYDPGFGFAKTPAQNFEMLCRLNELAHEFPVFVGVSKKSFLRETVYNTYEALCISIRRGAIGVRVHDIEPAKRAIEETLIDKL